MVPFVEQVAVERCDWCIEVMSAADGGFVIAECGPVEVCWIHFGGLQSVDRLSLARIEPISMLYVALAVTSLDCGTCSGPAIVMSASGRTNVLRSLFRSASLAGCILFSLFESKRERGLELLRAASPQIHKAVI